MASKRDTSGDGHELPADRLEGNNRKSVLFTGKGDLSPDSTAAIGRFVGIVVALGGYAYITANRARTAVHLKCKIGEYIYDDWTANTEEIDASTVQIARKALPPH